MTIEMNEIALTAMGMEFYAVIMDSTHIKFRTKNSFGYGTPLHIEQINPQFRLQLQEKGLIVQNWFKTK